MNRIIRLIISDLSKKYNFDETEAIEYLTEETLYEKQIESKNKDKKDKKDKKVPLPWMGIINETSCKALIYNYGLFTQCEHIPIENDSLCPSCKKHNAKLGTVYDRNKPNFNGMNNKKLVSYISVLKRRNISIDEAQLSARKEGFILDESYFQTKRQSNRNKEKVHDPNTEILEEDDDPIHFSEIKDYLQEKCTPDDDSCYEEITCNMIVYNDTKYLLDICNNNVYSTCEENKFVGKYDSERQNIDFNASEV